MILTTLVAVGAELVIRHLSSKLAESERENMRLGWRLAVVPEIEDRIESLHRGWRRNPETRPTEQTYLVVVYGVSFEFQRYSELRALPSGVPLPEYGLSPLAH